MFIDNVISWHYVFAVATKRVELQKQVLLQPAGNGTQFTQLHAVGVLSVSCIHSFIKTFTLGIDN